MKIEKISKLKSGKYKIKLENNIDLITYDDIILKYNILLKKEIDSDIINEISNDTNKYHIYNKVLKYIGIKMRSKLEIEKYLDKLEVDFFTKEEIISKLQSNGLLNDRNYVASFVTDKINLSNWGPNKIKKELMEHDIDAKIINDELAKYDEEIYEERIDKIINKKLKTNKNSSYIFKQKTINELINLGYDLSMIKEIIDNKKIDSSKALERDFQKIYKRLSNKFEGVELIRQTKNKLLAKGYKNDEISEFLVNYEI